uniref:Uncharacterized protein n=1 Tax=Globodera rostochiensis TaxID=31243 RepID=A0A914H8R5_GLORO
MSEIQYQDWLGVLDFFYSNWLASIFPDGSWKSRGISRRHLLPSFGILIFVLVPAFGGYAVPEPEHHASVALARVGRQTIARVS